MKAEIKEGQRLQINGRLGFLWNPVVEVISVNGAIATIKPVDASEGGILSFMNETEIGVDMLRSKTV